MHLDCRDYPADYTYAQVVSNELGVYVKVANFTNHNGQRVFRMLVDPELDRQQLRELTMSTVKDAHQTYNFAYLEAIYGPVVDESKHCANFTHYIRITFM
jgi:hypothetical protein